MSIEKNNITSEPVFYIFAFSTSENESLIILATVLLIYLIILSGNLLIISLISLEPRLHTPMYFFLCNLSTLDIVFSSTTLPKLMYICLTGDHVVSYSSCLAQMYLSVAFGDLECFLLTSMAIDRYVAVCFPLHYSLIMSKKVCGLLVFPAWFMSMVNSSILTFLTCNLSYFGLVEVKNFFCELKALMNITISDTTSLKNSIMVAAMYVGLIPSCMILASYVCIIHTVLKINSLAGRWKTFSSCSSHITTVIVFYGCGMTLYLSQSHEQELILSLIFYTLVPMLNPLLYSLRNKDITWAIRRRMNKKISCSL
ncbi:hypothetical protein GDO81_020440 [Engystomops pustulosus]|uniref:Olfactory receptor n=1 Tax=Engystomops pustulosus TaxID=76066 RepID=A0AAV6ZBM6_ENGPU|nr:hypothetical protein GDO81_020440 [Engystomops pustulosus]